MSEKESPDKKGHMTGSRLPGEHPHGDKGQVIIFFGFLIIWILDSFVFRYTTLLATHVPLIIRLCLAGSILVLAVYLVRSGHRAISDEVLSSPRLLTDGAFARVRHPLYLAALLFYVSLTITTLSLISLFVLAGIFIFYDYIATYEEEYCEQNFGQDYLAYKKNTPKWISRMHL